MVGDRLGATKLNEPIEALEALRPGAQSDVRTPDGLYGERQFFYLKEASGATNGVGTVVLEVQPASADDIVGYLWPELYTSANYTYTDNNTRQHTPSSANEQLTPRVLDGQVLEFRFMYHPLIDDVVWVDQNQAARQWAEIP